MIRYAIFAEMNEPAGVRIGVALHHEPWKKNIVAPLLSSDATSQ